MIARLSLARHARLRAALLLGALAVSVLALGVAPTPAPAAEDATPAAPAAEDATRADLMPVLGEDGLYKHPWFVDSFFVLGEDLAEAQAQGKRMVVTFEQRGCIYCKEVQTEVLTDPMINAFVRENFMVVQLNLFGDREVTDFDGKAMPEKDLARRWGVFFTPTFVFMPEDPATAEGKPGMASAVATMPGAFGKGTFLSLFEWVKDKGYTSDEHFQKYVARRLPELPFSKEEENGKE